MAARLKIRLQLRTREVFTIGRVIEIAKYETLRADIRWLQYQCMFIEFFP